MEEEQEETGTGEDLEERVGSEILISIAMATTENE